MTASSTAGKRRLRVGIIGAGFGGIALAVKLQRKTGVEFVVFERDSSVGGTWHQNRYPGCEVDIPSHAYSFSFLKYDWPRTHGTQAELEKYANHVVDHFDLRPHIRLNTAVEEAVWNDATKSYTLTTESGEKHEFDFVASAVGLLSEPRYPTWPGLDEFEGTKFHTSEWPQDVDLAGKRVAVVGTGSTAVQVVPAIQPIVEHVTVYQREPGWIEPKSERAFTPRERWIYKHVPLAQKLDRLRIFVRSSIRWKGYDARSGMQQKMKRVCLDFIDSSIKDPEVREAVTPDYPWGCKRPVVASNFYPALNEENASLVPHAVERVTKDGLVDATGRERKLDVLIMSTGFEAQQYLQSIRVSGHDGVLLHDVWRERPAAFLGVTVPKFPNLFILYGPNTNGGTSIIAQIERAAELAVRAIRKIERSNTELKVVDTDPAALAGWVSWIDHQLATNASAMNSGCHNYFTSESGAVVTQWPRPHYIYLLKTRFEGMKGLRFS